MQNDNKPYRILLVDDDNVDRIAFERALKRSSMEHHLRMCDNAKEALGIITQQEFDCVFLDYRLPGTTGLDLLRSIREKDVHTPVAILTSHGDEKLAVELLKSGAFDYFLKQDVNPDTLTKTIHAGVRLTKIEQDKQAVEEALKQSLAQLSAVLESTSSSVYALDRSYCYIAFNNSHKEAIKKKYGLDIGIGSSIKDHLDESAELDRIDRALGGERFSEVNVWGNKDFSSNYYEVAYNPIRNDKGEVIGVAVFSQDITEKKQAEEELLKAKNEALNAAQAKTDFLSNMSHEIRTPMNAIIGISELLLEKKMDDDVHEYLKTIKYSADNLLVIINDILDFSKIEAGKINLESVPFDLRERLDELRKTFKFRADEKGIGLRVSADTDVPFFIAGDPYRLNQILFNLVGNAIKFTSNGYVELKVKKLSESEGMVYLRFDVTDTGIGIPENKLETIFESFTQAYTDTTRKFGGTGLGLAITRNLVQLHGGELSVTSRSGEGSTFSFTLPYKLATPVKAEKADLADPSRDLSHLKILLVEDNTMNQFVAIQILKKWSANVEIASTGAEAITKLEHDKYDVVLMDLQMPEMSGYEATEYIRAKKTTVLNPVIPIIALTADAFDETKIRVFKAGMNDFITKPFKQDELYSKIIKHTSMA